jgi:LysR family transcriptional regulator, regulator for bpeEF and oprC
VKYAMHRGADAICQGLSSHFERRAGWFDACVHRESSGNRSRYFSDEKDPPLAQAVLAASHVRIALPAILAHTLVAPALPRFLEQHREMRVHLIITEGPGKPDRCDASIDIRPIDDHSEPYARRLATVPEVLCASEGFLAAYGKPRGPRDLNPTHCIGICDADEQPRDWSFHQGSTEVTFAPAAPLMFSDALSAVAAAVRGGGILLVPSLAVEAQIAAGLLVPLLQDWTAPGRAVYMQHDGPLTSQLRTFADFVAGLLPSD